MFLRPFSLISKLVLLAFVFGSFTLIQWQNQETKLRLEIAQQSDLDSRKQQLIEKAIDKISFGFLGNAKQHATEMQLMMREADALEKKSRNVALLLLVGIIVYSVILTTMLIRGTPYGTVSLVDLILVSVLTLILGITLPMLSISASKEIWGLGNIVLKSEIKSVLGTIKILWATMPFIAILIALFSIVTPFAKSILLVLAHIFPEGRSHSILHHIGKWSMADVFVIAIFIAYFALDQKDFTNATAGWGLWFFLAYCLLSMATSIIVGRGKPA